MNPQHQFTETWGLLLVVDYRYFYFPNEVNDFFHCWSLSYENTNVVRQRNWLTCLFISIVQLPLKANLSAAVMAFHTLAFWLAAQPPSGSLVQKHGTKMFCVSLKQDGTRFFFTLVIAHIADYIYSLGLLVAGTAMQDSNCSIWASASTSRTLRAGFKLATLW